MNDSAEKSPEIPNDFEETPVKPDETPPVLKIANYIRSLHMTPKKFIHNFLTSLEPEIVERRKYWGTEATWESTEQIIEDIRRITVDEKREEKVWNQYILRKAQCITESQNIPIRTAKDKKNVMFVSSTNIVHEDLAHSRDVDRQKLVQGSMPFIYQLICQKLRHSDLLRQRRSNSSKKGCEGSYDEEDLEAEADSGDDEDGSTQAQDTEASELQASRFEAYVYRKSNDKQTNQEHRLDSITFTLCSMLAFACNRSHNALQMENGLTFLAGGVSKRMNKYLGYIGLSTSRRTATRALRKLGSDTAKMIKSRSAEPTPVAPFICWDNLDFEERIHTERLEKSTKMFHGSWAYIHFLRPALLANVDPNVFTLNGFRKILLEAGKVDINPGVLLSKKEDHDRWRQTLKNQIAKTLFRYLSPSSPMSKHTLLNPPAVDPIDSAKPDIYMLRLMRSADNSADGAGSMYQEIREQLGLDEETFANRPQVFEGDLGTARNFQSIEDERSPSSYVDEAMNHIVMLLGAGHTLWNISQAIVLAHWGDLSDKEDFGAWQSVVALGGKKDKPLSKKDFTGLIRWVERVHYGTICHTLLEVLGLGEQALQQDLKLSPEKFIDVVDQTYERFFSGEALRAAEDTKDDRLSRLLLRLRDFATIVEASEATSAGDIGRLMMIYKRWSVMVQGMKGLTHYSIYLPRMVLLLNETLPPEVAHVLKHSMLVSPSGRPGHFVAKDVYLEVQNYWLKYFYNSSGIGTDSDRLIFLYSINIPLLRELLHKLKGRSGSNDIYQSHKNHITPASLKSFLRFARRNELTKKNPGSRVAAGAVKDCNCLGVQKLHFYAATQDLSRFQWSDCMDLQNPKEKDEIDISEILEWVTGE